MAQRWSPEKSTSVSIYSSASLAQCGVLGGGGVEGVEIVGTSENILN